MKVKLTDGSLVDLSTLTVNAATANQWAQNAHFCFALAVPLVPWLIFGRDLNLILSGALLAYAALKEFVYDEDHENPAERGSSVEDFIVQVCGGIVGLVLTLFLGHFGLPIVK